MADTGKVLITGGKGTIGRGLIEEFTQRGWDIASLDRDHAHDEVGFSLASDENDPRYARADVAEFRQLERVFDTLGPFDIVYHCAAEFGRWNGEDFYEQLWKTNAIGTKNMIRLQERLGFKLVHFSSSEVYGDWPEIMVESVMDDHEIRQMNDYAMSKWVNEMQVANSAVLHDTKTVVVRLFNTYGPGEYYSPYRSVNCRFIYCALHDIPWTVYRGHKRTSTYLADCARTLANISDNFIAGETYNIGGDALHTIEELSDLVIRVTGADPGLARAADSEVLTTTSKVVDISKSIKDLDHKNSVSLEEGLQLTVDWMRREYHLSSE